MRRRTGCIGMLTASTQGAASISFALFERKASPRITFVAVAEGEGETLRAAAVAGGDAARPGKSVNISICLGQDQRAGYAQDPSG